MRDLAVQSVRDPAGAAQVLLGIGLPRQVLWMALVLMAALQSVVFALSDLAVGGPTPMPLLFGSPLRFFAMAVVTLVLTVYAIQWVGRALGGEGALEDVMVVIVWLQGLRVVVQALVLVLSLTVPVLAMLTVLVASVLGIYIILHFINAAHRLDSLGKAFVVLIAALLAMVLGLSVLLSIIGVSLVGEIPNV